MRSVQKTLVFSGFAAAVLGLALGVGMARASPSTSAGPGVLVG